MKRFGSLLACSLLTSAFVVAPGCKPSEDIPVGQTGVSDTQSTITDSGTNTDSGTSDDTAGESGDQGTGDTGEMTCAEYNCGFGAGIDNPDTNSADPCICECSVGYINEDENDPTTPCVLDTSCVQVRPLECRTSVDEGSAVGMTFSLTYCSGDPKTDLDLDDVILEEIQNKDWEELLPAESAVTIVDKQPVHHIYLVVDISQSVQEANLLPQLQTSIENFIDSVQGQGHPVRVGLYAFDGAYSLYTIVADTDDLAAAKAGVVDITTLQGNDPLSTNLYGAVINGIIKNDGTTHRRKTSSRRGVLTTGTVIVISDGDDEAGRKTLQEVQTELGLSTTNIITVGLGQEENYPTLASLGEDGAFPVTDPSELPGVFSNLAERMDLFAQSTYVLGYCSPKRGGTAQVRARFKDAPDVPNVVQEAVCDIDATFFDSGCSANTFVESSACASRECGGVIGCGTCGDDQGCVLDSCVPLNTAGWVTEGQACNPQAMCVTGTACINNTCQVPAAIGEACNPGCDAPNAYCFNDGMSNTCQPTVADGGICTSNAQCASGNCANGGGNTVQGTCTNPPPYREDCTTLCDDGFYCPGPNQKCARLKYDREDCTQDLQCRSGACLEFPDNVKACAWTGYALYDEGI